MASKCAPLPAGVRRQHWRRTVSAVGLAAAAAVTRANFVATGRGPARRELLAGLLVALQGGDAASATDESFSKAAVNADLAGKSQECRDSCLKDWCNADPRSCDCHAVLAAAGYTVPRSAPEAVAAAGVSKWEEALDWRAATAPGWPAAPEDALLVKDSTIAGAGKGLFAAEPLAAGTVVSAYIGKQLTVAEAQTVRKGPPQEVTEYMWCPLRGNEHIDDLKGAAVQTTPSYCVDAKDRTQKNPGRYANAASEDYQCKLWNLELCELGQVMYFRTKTAVQAGAELVTDYGPNYWEDWGGCTRRKSSESRVIWNWLKSRGIF